MNFAFKGFFQDGTFRVFSFEAGPKDLAQGSFWVRADMNLARKHKIQVQELPLLCRAVLEDHTTVSGEHTVTYTGAEMLQHANRLAIDQQKRVRRPFRPNRAEEVKEA
jgi:hypothetical protein